MRTRKTERDFPPVNLAVTRRVRFEEVDTITFMWHGRYASWLEDGREAMGAAHNISYEMFYANNVAIPLKTLNFDFIAPLRYNIEYSIQTSLLWNEAALLEFEYQIVDCGNNIMTRASSIQLMTSLQGKLLIEAPDFYRAFCEKWKQSKL